MKNLTITVTNEAELRPVKETAANGVEIDSFNLHVDGVEKYCGFQQAIPYQAAIEGAPPKLLRPPCNSRCANFRLQVVKKDLNSEGRMHVMLSCGVGASYPLAGEVKKESSLHLQK